MLVVAFAACAGGPPAGAPMRGPNVAGSMLDASPAPQTPRGGGGAPAPNAATTAANAPAATQPPVDVEPPIAGGQQAEQTATGAPVDPVEDALQLAARLCSEEEHRGALLALDTTLAHADALSANDRALLMVARAGVLRDLGERHLAAVALRGVLAAHGPAALHPGLLMELAELDWLEGNRQGALAGLEQLEAVHAGDAWLVAHAADVQGLKRELSTAPRPVRLQLRDLLGNLRGAPEASERMRALELAVAPLNKGSTAGDEAVGRLRATVVAIAARDESPALRARALQLAEVDAEWSRDLCAAGLGDPSPLVRGIAATRAIELLRQAAAPLLLQALEREPDADTFCRLHEALAVIVPAAPRFVPGAATDAERRALLVAAWKRVVTVDAQPPAAQRRVDD